jgi:HSP20 family protein
MISAFTENLKEETDTTFVRREFNFRNFKRSFWLPENIKSEAIVASYHEGLLRLTLPKMAKATTSISKFIPIV